MDDKYLILMKAAERCPGHWEFEKGETYWVQRDVALRMAAKNSAVIVSRPKAKRVEPKPVATEPKAKSKPKRKKSRYEKGS